MWVEWRWSDGDVEEWMEKGKEKKKKCWCS